MAGKRKYNTDPKAKISAGEKWTYHLELTKDTEVAYALALHRDQTQIPYDETILKALRQYLL